MTAVLVIATALLLAGGAFFIAPWLWRRAGERRLAEAAARARAVVLSYDDGPGRSLTPRLLDLLASRNASASFFMLGRNAEASGDIVARALAEGHEVGSHSHDHSNAWKSWPGTVARDFAKGHRTMAALGAGGALFRPPYGKLTLLQWLIERRRGSRFAWWTVDSRDSWDRRPVSEVVAEVRQKGGGVVLMHDWDSYPHARGEPPHAEHLLSLTGAILDLAEEQRLKVMTLSELERLADRG